MSIKPYWIKERHNSQLRTYFVACGQLSVTAAKRKEAALYGDNYMLRFDTAKDYAAKLAELRKAGERVVEEAGR